MSYSQNINQLLTTAFYFAQPIGERRRDEKAFKKAQIEADKRTAEIIEQIGTGENLTDEQLEYAANLQANAAKAKFERTPSAETLKEWSGASKAKEDILGNIANDRWEPQAIQKIQQGMKYEKLREQLEREEKAPIPNPYKKEENK